MSDRGSEGAQDQDLGDSSGFGFGLEPTQAKSPGSGAAESPADLAQSVKADVRALQQKEEKEEEETKSEGKLYEGSNQNLASVTQNSPPASSPAAFNLQMTPEQMTKMMASMVTQVLQQVQPAQQTSAAPPGSPIFNASATMASPGSEQVLSGESAGSARQGAGKQLQYLLADYKKAVSRIDFGVNLPSTDLGLIDKTLAAVNYFTALRGDMRKAGISHWFGFDSPGPELGQSAAAPKLQLTASEAMALVLDGQTPGSMQYAMHYVDEHKVAISQHLAVKLQRDLQLLATGNSNGHVRQYAIAVRNT